MARNLFLSIILLTISAKAFCDDMPVHIKANNMNFNQEAGTITAAGSVEIDFEGLVIYSDQAWVDTKANVATAEGNVKVKHKDYNISSSSITYDISAETSVVLNLKTVFYPSDIKTNLYVQAKKLRDLPDIKMGEYGILTTCDYDEPHYHLEARWFDYYPDDKLVGYWTTMYAGSVPLFVVPYYVYNLKTHKSPYTFVYGQNDVEGRFLKTSYDYFFNNSSNGVFYFDTTEIKGPGYGFKHDYKTDLGWGSLYYYRINEQDTHLSDYAFTLTHSINLDKYSKLSLATDSYNIYTVPAGRKYNTDSSVGYNMDNGQQRINTGYSESDDNITYTNTRAFNISNNVPGMNTLFKWDETKHLVGQKTDLQHDTFSHNQSLFTNDLNLSINVAYSSYATDEGAIADERLDPQVDLTYKGPFYSAKLTQKWYVDPDGRNFRGDDNLNYLEKLPELTINFNPVDLKYVSLSTSVGYAQYHEAQYVPAFLRMRHMRTTEEWLRAGLSRGDDLGFGTRLTTGLALEQYEYGTGDERYRLEESARLDTGLGGFFRNNVTWGRARADGATPFFFESLGSQWNYIKESVSLYYQSYVNWTTAAGYNYMNSTYDDVTTNLTITPNPVFSSNINTGWSIERQQYLDLNIGATVRPWDKFTNTANIQYDMNVGQLKSANSLMDLEVGDTWEDRWHFKMGHSYDFTLDRYVLTDLAIVKDLHCWEAVFTYNDWMKEFRFGLSLKAFPSFPLTFVAGQSGSYFDSFMNNMHFEQDSPRRY